MLRVIVKIKTNYLYLCLKRQWSQLFKRKMFIFQSRRANMGGRGGVGVEGTSTPFHIFMLVNDKADCIWLSWLQVPSKIFLGCFESILIKIIKLTHLLAFQQCPLH